MVKHKNIIRTTIGDVCCIIARSVNAFLSRKYLGPTRQRISLSALTAQPYRPPGHSRLADFSIKSMNNVNCVISAATDIVVQFVICDNAHV
jgi:hypothetical protein